MNPIEDLALSFFGVLAISYLIIAIPLVLLFVVTGWRIFSKAGQPGWAILIPFYNLYVYTQVLRRPKWWILLYLIGTVPFAGPWAMLFVSIIDALRLAKVFRKPPVFGVGVLLLGVIFIPVLAFGEAQYDGVSADESELI